MLLYGKAVKIDHVVSSCHSKTFSVPVVRLVRLLLILFFFVVVVWIAAEPPAAIRRPAKAFLRLLAVALVFVVKRDLLAGLKKMFNLSTFKLS